MQRKRNEDGGWQAAGWRFRNETAPSTTKTVASTTKTVASTTKTVSPATKSITTFDVYRQNRVFHRML